MIQEVFGITSSNSNFIHNSPNNFEHHSGACLKTIMLLDGWSVFARDTRNIPSLAPPAFENRSIKLAKSECLRHLSFGP